MNYSIKQSNPFFIFGNYRSGTTMFRLMLNNHPQICIPPECGFIQWWYSKYKDWTKICSQKESKVNEFITDLLSSRKMDTWNLNIQSLKNLILTEQPKNYGEICTLVYKSFCLNIEKQFDVWGDKNNYYVNHLNMLNKIYPNAKYILLMRDGRDVACSYINTRKIKSNSKYAPKLTDNITEIATEWQNNAYKSLEFFSTISNKKYITIRYEDLVLNTFEILSRMCEFLDVPYSAEMENYYISNKENNIEPIEFLAWKRKTLEKPDKNNIGKFQTELSSKAIQTFENIAHDILEKFNYI